jgi:hypothetical protein
MTGFAAPYIAIMINFHPRLMFKGSLPCEWIRKGSMDDSEGNAMNMQQNV